MSYELWYRDAESGGTWIEITDRIPKDGWTLREQSEEGSVPTSEVPIADQAMDLDIDGLRSIYVKETTSESDDNILYYGYTWNQGIDRGRDETFEPLGRAWGLSVVDRNGYWERVVMRGTDCNRPAETDVARMTWLLGTSEAATFDDITSFFSTVSPVLMDAVDYRGQTVGQVVADCAEAAGKNWWVKVINDGADNLLLTVWYGKDSLDAYDSDLSLTNDPSEWTDSELLDGTSTVWPVAEDTKVDRDPTRLVCGIYAQYDGGTTYRHNQTTHDAFGHRDKVVPMPNVKTKAKAQARADRMLQDLATQYETCDTKVRLPKAKATKIRAGMRVLIKLTHVPNWDDWQWCRVLACEVTPVSSGAFYDLGLTLTPTGQDSAGPGSPPPSDDLFAGLQRSRATNGSYGVPSFCNAYPSALAAPGWDTQATTGDVALDQSSNPFTSMTISADGEVAIYARMMAGGVAIPAVSRHMDVLINGAVVGTVAHTLSGAVHQAFAVTLRNVAVSAGDVISIGGSNNVFWTSYGLGDSYLVVVRGDFTDTTGFEGP